MTIPNSDRHGVRVNDGSGTPKLIHAAWVNDGTVTPKAAKEIWINNAQTLTRVWPPRAYVVELVPVGSFDGNMGITLVDQTSSTTTTSSTNGLCNNGNWNAIWGGVRQPDLKQVTFAFRRWDRYDAVGNYDFSGPNLVRRTTATASIPGNVGFGHGGLWKTLLQTSPYDPNDKRTHSPFVVIEPGSQILCIRLSTTKTYSSGSGEGGSGPMAKITFVTGNATYFGSQTVTTQSFSANANDVPSALSAPTGVSVSAASNAVATGFGIISAKGSRGKFGVNTSITYGGLNTGTWMSSKNYSTTGLSSTLYGFEGSITNTANIVSPGTLPAITTGAGGNRSTLDTGSTHVGWKYITMDADDSAASGGASLRNYNMSGTDFTGDLSLGSTLFLVIPP
jgi:hypothetical protein